MNSPQIIPPVVSNTVVPPSLKYQVTQLLEAPVTELNSKPEMGVAITMENLRQYLDANKQICEIGPYKIKVSGDFLQIGSWSINVNDFYSRTLTFYPSNILTLEYGNKRTRNDTQILEINPHTRILKNSEGNIFEGDLVTANESTVVFIKENKLYTQSIIGDEAQPKEIDLPVSMQVVSPLVITVSGNIIYGLTKIDTDGLKLELYMNGERVGDIPELQHTKVIQIQGDICILEGITTNGIQEHYQIDTSLSRARPAGTELRVSIARKATRRVLDWNAKLGEKINDLGTEKTSLIDVNKALTARIAELDAAIISQAKEYSEQVKKTADTSNALIWDLQRQLEDANYQSESLQGELTKATEKLRTMNDILAKAPAPTGLLSKSVPAEAYGKLVESLKDIAYVSTL